MRSVLFSRLLISSIACLACAVFPARAAVFGSVVAIGGSASDIVLDESRSSLYIANFGAHTIQVMSTASNTIQPASLNVLPWPGAMALSFDSQYLVVAHYCNGVTEPACSNALTSIHLTDNSQRVFSLASPPLGLAFLKNGKALIVTTTNILLFNPANGVTQLVSTLGNIAQTLPVPLATFPGQIIQAALAASSDGNTVWGIASAGTPTQLILQYNALTGTISGVIATSSPTLLPRISSSADGAYAMVGYMLLGAGSSPYLKGRYPNAIASTNITGSVIDSTNRLVYGQFPDKNQATGPLGTAGSGVSAMLILDSDNLTFRDRISIPENMVGRALLTADAAIMYVVSESGVMVLPVGSLNAAHRITATQEDILLTTNFCANGVISRDLTITDPGGGHTDFSVISAQPGVAVSPASGTTPATVKILVDPKAIPGAGGTSAFFLTLSSHTAVNQPKPIRLLVNNPDPSQRGAIVGQPGVLSDILPDQTRNRVYVLRQDMNQLQLFDGSALSLIKSLRTATSPTMMAMTNDGKFLLVGHDDSQLVTVYDLDALASVAPVLLPASHFARSIAVSNSTILTLVRNEGNVEPTPAGIDSINLTAGNAAPLLSLGVYNNKLSATGALSASSSGANILYASPDGYVALYTGAAGTFVNSRHDFTALSGALAASDFGYYVAGNSILNASLVPEGVVSQSALLSSGFTFTAQDGYMAATASVSAPGTITHATLQTGTPAPAVLSANSWLTSEAPLLPTATTQSLPAISPVYGTYGSGTFSIHALNSFARTVAPLTSSGSLAMLSTSGLSLLSTTFPANALPSIAAIASAADGTKPVAAGGLVGIYGQNMSDLSLAASTTPLSTAMGNSCIGVNGVPIPLLYVSPGQINAQLPFNSAGNATLTIHTPAGTSNNFSFRIQPTAPSIFIGTANGVETPQALIVRDDNFQLVTPTNPVHPRDTITIYLTGMGQTNPPVPTGETSPSDPLAYVATAPLVTLGGAPLSILYAGLAPGEIGVYQINATVPGSVPTGVAIPLAISQGGAAGQTVNVRVVK